ncbi:MAG: polysaccharide ABC transporter ATP-binding protein [Terriglobia bacterium]
MKRSQDNNEFAIRAEGIGKRYKLGAQERYRTLRDTLVETATAPFRIFQRRRGPDPAREFWALKDISFDVKQGEVVGIIGRNGAGKSTLLKILSRITEPTEGEAVIHGRIGSLLEVGTGFHPELSGRENIYLNGAILGMRKAEIQSKFDDIVAFAEVERFIDTPVKHYSSGMYTRLAFAVAAHLEPEILVIDEVLAVGDLAFQKKCLGKMREVANTGRTVLFVSHNMTAVRSLCSRVVWLQQGTVNRIGKVGEVVGEYLSSSGAAVMQLEWPNPDEAPGDDQVRLSRVSVKATHDDGSGMVNVATALTVEVCYWNFTPDVILNVSLEVYSVEEVCLFASFDTPRPRPQGLIRSLCEIPANFLNDTMYQIKVLLVRDAGTILLKHEGLTVEVNDVERDVPYYGKWVGICRPTLRWSSEVLTELPEVTNVAAAF